MCRNTQNTRLFGVRLAILLYAVGTTMWSMRIEEDHTRWMQRLTHWGCACTIVYFARSTYFSYTQLNEIVGKATGDNVLNNAAPTLFVFTLANSLMYWAVLLTFGYKGRHTFSDIWELQVHLHFVINVWFAIDIFMTRVRFSYVHLWSAMLAHILYMDPSFKVNVKSFDSLSEMEYDVREIFLDFINDSMGSVNCRIDYQMVESWGVKKIFMLEDSGLSIHGTAILATANQPPGHILLTALCYNPADISNARMVIEAVARTHREDERFSKFEICCDLVSDNTEIQSVAAEVGWSRVRDSEDGWTLFALQPSKIPNPVDIGISPDTSQSSVTSSNSRGVQSEDQSTDQELLIKMQRDFNDEVAHYTRFRTKSLRSKDTIDVSRNENVSEASIQINTNRIDKSESPARLTHSSSSKLSCESCDTTFTLKGNLKRHINSVHEKLRPFSCESCNTAFSQKQKLKQHVSFV
eukprot:907923_1